MALEWAGTTRHNHIWLIALLPLGGWLVAFLYKKWGKSVAGGNNLLIEEVQKPNKIIHILMAPLVLVGTIITHLFGGSAGREGTAVQMGGSIADQLSYLIKPTQWERKLLLSSGIAAGFAGVFGTPIAGCVFALEVIFIGKINYKAILPVLLSAFFASYVCDLWPITHTVYEVAVIPSFSLSVLGWIIGSAIVFGLVARVFNVGLFRLGYLLKSKLKNTLIHPIIGGVVVAGLGYLLGTRYLGLGVDVIVESFAFQQGFEAFLIKLLLTVITLASGFKGGEVTPLFFIGATLGSALSVFVPLDVSFLAALGFVGVFAGATNAPIACALMGAELFGIEIMPYVLVSCFVAYFFSGHSGIYASQIVGISKNPFSSGSKGKTLQSLMHSRFKL